MLADGKELCLYPPFNKIMTRKTANLTAQVFICVLCVLVLFVTCIVSPEAHNYINVMGHFMSNQPHLAWF
jgi:hypothetical protein